MKLLDHCGTKMFQKVTNPTIFGHCAFRFSRTLWKRLLSMNVCFHKTAFLLLFVAIQLFNSLKCHFNSGMLFFISFPFGPSITLYFCSQTTQYPSDICFFPPCSSFHSLYCLLSPPVSFRNDANCRRAGLQMFAFRPPSLLRSHLF